MHDLKFGDRRAEGIRKLQHDAHLLTGLDGGGLRGQPQMKRIGVRAGSAGRGGRLDGNGKKQEAAKKESAYA